MKININAKGNNVGWFILSIFCFMTGHWVFGLLFLVVAFA
jgi:hypothetical protein